MSDDAQEAMQTAGMSSFGIYGGKKAIASIDKEMDLGWYESTADKKSDKADEEAATLATEEAEKKKLSALEAAKADRMSMFKTEGGSSGEQVFNVGARDTYYGN